MFGTFRTLLALAVVFDHLGGARYVGPYAVFGFYTLSGYLMTLIMHQSYGYTPAGMVRYGLNRWLRIFPLYYLAAACSLGLILLIGEAEVRAFHESIGLPNDLHELLRNAFLILSINTETRLVPPAWALTVECFFYIVIGLGLSRTRTVTWIWFALSIAYTLYLVAGSASFSYRYYTIAAASLPFSMGALIFHLRTTGFRYFATVSQPRLLWTLLGLLVANYVIAIHSDRTTATTYCFYFNLFLMGLIVSHLARQSLNADRRLDKIIGELSYPIYLIHFQAGMLVTFLVPSLSRGEWPFLFASIPVIIGASWLLHRMVETPIELLRGNIRNARQHR